MHFRFPKVCGRRDILNLYIFSHMYFKKFVLTIWQFVKTINITMYNIYFLDYKEFFSRKEQKTVFYYYFNRFKNIENSFLTKLRTKYWTPKIAIHPSWKIAFSQLCYFLQPNILKFCFGDTSNLIFLFLWKNHVLFLFSLFSATLHLSFSNRNLCFIRVRSKAFWKLFWWYKFVICTCWE